MISKELREAYDFFRENAGWCSNGHRPDGTDGSATCAMRLARAELRMRRGDEGLAFYVQDEEMPWDGEPPAPKYLYCCLVVSGVEEEDAHWVFNGKVRACYDSEPPWKKRGVKVRASLGMVGVNRWRDPYLRVVAAELADEAYGEIDAERDAEACVAAAELQARPTYAQVGYGGDL